MPGNISIRIEKYMADTIDDFLEDTTALVVMPSMYHLFDVITATTRIEDMEGRDFHRATARVLFLCKGPSPDIHPEVSLMTTRVK